MKNVEKAKRLREIRENLKWGQAKMAEELELNRSYLSELENGAATIQDYVINRAEAIAKRPNPDLGGQHLLDSDFQQPTVDSCRAYFESYLMACEEDPSRLGWTWVELTERFPLNKWEKSNSSRVVESAKAGARASALTKSGRAT